MSALYVICPQCGPLMSFMPQGGQFEIDVKCLCGVKIAHKENGHNYETRKVIQEKINSMKGKHTVSSGNNSGNADSVQRKMKPQKMNKENSEQTCRIPGG